MTDKSSTTDLVARLRQGCGGEPCRMMEARSGCTCAEAADEIERLRSENFFLRKQVEAEAEFWNKHGPGAGT